MGFLEVYFEHVDVYFPFLYIISATNVIDLVERYLSTSILVPSFTQTDSEL